MNSMSPDDGLDPAAFYPDERFADDNGDVPAFRAPEPEPPDLVVYTDDDGPDIDGLNYEGVEAALDDIDEEESLATSEQGLPDGAPYGGGSWYLDSVDSSPDELAVEAGDDLFVEPSSTDDYLARFTAMGHDSPDSDIIVGASHDVIEYELDEDEL